MSSNLTAPTIFPPRKVSQMAEGGIRAQNHYFPFCNPEFNPWTRQEDKLLGTMPDAEVAKRIGRSVISVLKRRLRLGIPNRSPVNHVWTQKQIALLGTMSGREVAEMIGCPVVCSPKRNPM